MKRRGAGLHPERDHLRPARLRPSSRSPLYSAIVEGHPLALPWTRTAILSGVYLALLGSVAGAWLNYWLLKRIGATKLLSMGLIEPLIAVLLGAVFLDERLTLKTAIGGVCILVAVGVVLDLAGSGTRPRVSAVVHDVAVAGTQEAAFRARDTTAEQPSG